MQIASSANCTCKRVGVRLRIDRQRADAQFLAGANDAHGDFAAIGYQDFVEHGDLNSLGLKLRGGGRAI